MAAAVARGACGHTVERPLFSSLARVFKCRPASVPVPRVSDPAKPSLLAPFRVVSFRFQWPADLLTAWAFEMETLILGWYVLVETNSVLLLTVFGSLQFVGTLISPTRSTTPTRRDSGAACG